MMKLGRPKRRWGTTLTDSAIGFAIQTRRLQSIAIKELREDVHAERDADGARTDRDEFGIILMIMMMMRILALCLLMAMLTEWQDVELNVVGSSDGEKVKTRRIRLRRGITMDSGAANMVMPRRMVRNRALITPSKASRLGVHYVTANDGRIPNEGETQFKFKTNEGHDQDWLFQIAEVNKALGSISYLVDEGYRVVFDKDMSTGRDISYMLYKANKQTTRFRRERNVWVLDAIIEEDEDRAARFHRHA